uniref:Uncharacterized protein n=1 Tax=Rousettus aegyptiacus TaxID=9407 RepID=A0A7J8BAN3_ROUAE|nr:hypothetical protein HJG63_009937 [Rousettus aegyptiacus]
MSPRAACRLKSPYGSRPEPLGASPKAATARSLPRPDTTWQKRLSCHSRGQEMDRPKGTSPGDKSRPAGPRGVTASLRSRYICGVGGGAVTRGGNRSRSSGRQRDMCRVPNHVPRLMAWFRYLEGHK